MNTMPRAALRPVSVALALALSACPAATTTSAARPEGRRLETPPLCDHRVPEAECVRHHPDLVAGFKERGDWCPEHEVPETQCLECHPGTVFVVLPPLSPSADLSYLVNMGEDVPSLEAHAVPGKVTVFDFWAQWCGACRNVDAGLHELVNARSDVAVRKLNVMSWESPLAQRYLKEVPALPWVVVHGKDGRRVGTVSGLDLAALDALVTKASGS